MKHSKNIKHIQNTLSIVIMVLERLNMALLMETRMVNTILMVLWRYLEYLWKRWQLSLLQNYLTDIECIKSWQVFDLTHFYWRNNIYSNHQHNLSYEFVIVSTHSSIYFHSSTPQLLLQATILDNHAHNNCSYSNAHIQLIWCPIYEIGFSNSVWSESDTCQSGTDWSLWYVC